MRQGKITQTNGRWMGNKVRAEMQVEYIKMFPGTEHRKVGDLKEGRKDSSINEVEI